jgi:hypothetical protein
MAVIDEASEDEGEEPFLDSREEKKRPQVYARLQLSMGTPSASPTPEEIESSVTIAQELNELMGERRNSSAGEGASLNISPLNTVKGLLANAKWIQNLLGGVADIIESSFNLANWSDPNKVRNLLHSLATGMPPPPPPPTPPPLPLQSAALFILVVSLSLLCLLFPTRYLVLAGGLFEFANGYRIGRREREDGKRKESKKKREKEKMEKDAEREKAEAEVGKEVNGGPVYNLIASAPTNEDLRRHYFWESKRRGEVERARVAEKRRVGRLSTIWKAKWQGSCFVRQAEAAEGLSCVPPREREKELPLHR